MEKHSHLDKRRRLDFLDFFEQVKAFVSGLCDNEFKVELAFAFKNGHIDFGSTYIKGDNFRIDLSLLDQFFGLENGEGCVIDIQCQTQFCNNKFVCEDKRSNGKGCTENDDCISNQCKTIPNGVSWSCSGVPLFNDWPCGMDVECASGYCSLEFRCRDKLNNGQLCVEHDDCVSGRCANTFRCTSRLSRNNGCSYHVDCQSLSCRSGGGNCWWPTWCCN